MIRKYSIRFGVLISALLILISASHYFRTLKEEKIIRLNNPSKLWAICGMFPYILEWPVQDADERR